MVVQHNLTAMNANRLLGVTSKSQAKSTEKLSSGYRINRAADDAAGLAISEKMRKQIKGLTQASSNAQDGISAVQTAEGALQEVTDMLQRMNQLAVQAANSTNSEADRSNIQDEIDQLITEIDRVSETTKFNETYLLKGDKSGTIGKDYAYTKQYKLSDEELFVNQDGQIKTIKAGSVLSEDVDYYRSTTKAGNKVDFTVTMAGEKIESIDYTKYADQKKVIASNNYYIKDAGGNFVKVNSNSVYDKNLTYYKLTKAQGSTISTATELKKSDMQLEDKWVVKEGVTVYNTSGQLVAAGQTMANPGQKTYFSDLGGVSAGLYFTKNIGINTEGLYTKDIKTGEFQIVKKGDAYDKNQTYYKLENKFVAGGLMHTMTALTQDAVTTGTIYKAAYDLFDDSGDLIKAGEVLDSTAEYYTNPKTVVEKSSKVDIKKYQDAGDYQLCDKDGNEVAANGLYRYFKEDGTYDATVNGGLFIKSGDELVSASDATIRQYVEVKNADMGKLKLSLHVGADATKENQISIELDSMSASTLGIKDVKVTGNDDTNALNAIETIAAALSKVTQQRSGLGAIQNRLEHTISNLDNIVENTTSAESQIRDTDMATEMVNYSKNNILAQAGQSMLAQANQSNQGVLSLLG